MCKLCYVRACNRNQRRRPEQNKKKKIKQKTCRIRRGSPRFSMRNNTPGGLGGGGNMWKTFRIRGKNETLRCPGYRMTGTHKAEEKYHLSFSRFSWRSGSTYREKPWTSPPEIHPPPPALWTVLQGRRYGRRRLVEGLNSSCPHNAIFFFFISNRDGRHLGPPVRVQGRGCGVYLFAADWSINHLS